MTRLKHGNLSDLSESGISLKKYSVIVETCSGASNAKVRECAKEVLSRGCRDIYFTGYDCNRWHNIFDEEDTANYGGKALTSDMPTASSLCLCKKKIYVLYQSRFIRKRKNLNLDDITEYIEFFYEDRGVIMFFNSVAKRDCITATAKIHKSKISMDNIIQIGESTLASELDVTRVKVQRIDQNKVLINIYR